MSDKAKRMAEIGETIIPALTQFIEDYSKIVDYSPEAGTIIKARMARALLDVTDWCVADHPEEEGFRLWVSQILVIETMKIFQAGILTGLTNLKAEEAIEKAHLN